MIVEPSCIFCRIAKGEIPSKTIFEDEDVRVILDLSPASRGHALVIPKKHYDDLCQLDIKIAQKILPLAGRIGEAMKKTLPCLGFNIVQNNGAVAGQSVFHFHMHIIPRYEDGPSMITWEPGHMESEYLEEIANIIKSGL